MKKLFTLFWVFVACIQIANATEGALSGKFTINASGDQIVFSQGNLQYQASSNTWRFAENQYDAIGDANSAISSTNEGWIDLFGWGTSGYDNTVNDPCAINFQPWATTRAEINLIADIKGTDIESINCEMLQITGSCDTTWADGGTYSSNNVNIYGYGPSTALADKNLTGKSANYDWGVYNAINNGGNQLGLWRTLTYEEWYYLLYTRPLALYLHSQATVCNVHGYILLPDNFSLPQGLSWNYQTNNWNTNIYDNDTWEIMESIGAVFLPAAGYRYETGMSGVGEGTGYWSASVYDEREAKQLYFTETIMEMGKNTRFRGRSVRLVQAYINTEIPTTIDNVDVTKSVHKLLRDGQILILRGDKTYTVTGQAVR